MPGEFFPSISGRKACGSCGIIKPSGIAAYEWAARVIKFLTKPPGGALIISVFNTAKPVSDFLVGVFVACTNKKSKNSINKNIEQ